MVKLYKFADGSKYYWETWEHDGVHTVHWGTLGTRGYSKELRSTFFKKATDTIQKEIDQRISEGFGPIDPDDLAILLIEFAVDGMGNGTDLDKRHRLEERMNEMLGWTGLGNCDGGSIGSGTMEVCCYVVDFDIAKSVIEADLNRSEFCDYSRIYRKTKWTNHAARRTRPSRTGCHRSVTRAASLSLGRFQSPGDRVDHVH